MPDNTKRGSDPWFLTIFHFGCSLCGSRPREDALRRYLAHWKISPPERLAAFLGALSKALEELKVTKTWFSKDFFRHAEEARREIRDLGSPLEIPYIECLTRFQEGSLHFLVDCPLCRTPAGSRGKGNYFTWWGDACRVQAGNLLYDAQLVLWNVTRFMPEWADVDTLNRLNGLRKTLHATALAIELLECPLCRRPTNCLFGEGSARACSWCLDMRNAGTKGFLQIVRRKPKVWESEDPDDPLLFQAAQLPGPDGMVDQDLLPPGDS
jgi:hypothetical protein